MNIIKPSDIDVTSLNKSPFQGTKSTLYVEGDKCIKILNGLYTEEKQALYRKFREMEGISIENVLLPIDLIAEGDILHGYTMENFMNSAPLTVYFGCTRYVSGKDLFKAIKQASLILREIHRQGIICQDLSFDNVLIDNKGTIKYCDIDGCTYKEMMSPFLSVLLKRYLIDYRKEKITLVSKNLDRISFILSTFLVAYGKEIHKLSKKEYYRLSEVSSTFNNMTNIANILRNRGTFITDDLPYVDELVDDNDDFIIDRNEQISILRKLFRR